MMLKIKDKNLLKSSFKIRKMIDTLVFHGFKKLGYEVEVFGLAMGPDPQ